MGCRKNAVRALWPGLRCFIGPLSRQGLYSKNHLVLSLSRLPSAFIAAMAAFERYGQVGALLEDEAEFLRAPGGPPLS